MRRYKVGRSETNEVTVADASVSRVHAELVELGGGRFALTDLGSTYGTQVLQGQGWVPAAETEIHTDTPIRFGEFQTTLRDVLSDLQRAALGLVPDPAPSPAAPSPTPPPAAVPPVPVPPLADPRASDSPAAPHGGRRLPPRARPRHAALPTRRRGMILGLLALGVVGGVAAAAVAAILMFGDATPTPRGDAPAKPAAAEVQARILDSCTKQWGVQERRCRCFLAAAGPHLLADDYDDFAEMVEAYVSGDTTRQESALQRATETRGAPANSRLTAAFKGAVRDCQQ